MAESKRDELEYNKFSLKENNGDITNDVEEIEDATSADTEKNGLGVVVMGAIIIGLGVIFMYSRSKKRQQH